MKHLVNARGLITFSVDRSLMLSFCNLHVQDDCSNVSDHKPLCFDLALCNISPIIHGNCKPVVCKFRWDHGNLGYYYARTYELLSKVDHKDVSK